MIEIKFEDELLDAHLARAEADVPAGHFSLPQIDQLIGGIRPGRFTILSGEPGVAKTTLVGQLADDAASSGFAVIVNTQEIAPHQLVAKSLTRLGYKPHAANEAQSLRAVELYRNNIAPNICFIDEALTAVELGAVVGRVERERNASVILFQDYIQIMPTATEQRSPDERQAIKEAVSGLRRIANSHNIPVFAVSSVNRTTYGKASADLSALGGCNALEYAADTVLYLHVEGKGAVRAENMAQQIRPLVLAALKNRYAPTGSVKLSFDTGRALFTER